jgi:glycolate oxidase FAD binding subunit
MCSAAAATAVESFIALVRSSVPSIQIRLDALEQFSIDGLKPEVLVTPAAASELQAVLAEAYRTGLTVIPIGGGTHIAAGNAPSSYDVAVSLASMNRLVAHEPADLTVTVEPGLPLSTLQAQLASHGQFLPLDPAAGAAATVGGVLAANAYGPLRHAYGTARDWLIGLSVVQADGTMTKSGGRVVKNVAGYDMHKLHVGALGTLGVIAQATFKVAPLPAARRTLSIRCDTAGQACHIALDAWNVGLTLHAMEAVSPASAQAVVGDSGWTLLIEAAGGAGAVERSVRDLRALSTERGGRVDESLDRGVWVRWGDVFRPRGLAIRAAVAPSDAARAIDAIASIHAVAPTRLSTTVSAGVIRAGWDNLDDAAAAVCVTVARRALPPGASVVVEAASPEVKRRIDAFGPLRRDFEIMRRLKAQFDPGRVLSPGRFVGKL